MAQLDTPVDSCWITLYSKSRIPVFKKIFLSCLISVHIAC